MVHEDVVVGEVGAMHATRSVLVVASRGRLSSSWRVPSRLWSLARWIALLLVTVACTGCALTLAGFSQNRYSLSNTEVCLAARAAHNAGDGSFIQMVYDEATRRGLNGRQCRSLVAQHDRRAAAVGLAIAGGVAAGATIAAAASQRGGSRGSYYVADYDWDWDLYYNAQGQLVWSCRGIQTGRFAPLSNCRYKTRTDRRWPSLSAP